MGLFFFNVDIPLQRALIKKHYGIPGACWQWPLACVLLFSSLQHVMVDPQMDTLFFYSEAIVGVIMNQSKKIMVATTAILRLWGTVVTKTNPCPSSSLNCSLENDTHNTICPLIQIWL